MKHLLEETHMKLRIFLLIWLLLPAMAFAETRAEKIETLIEAQGLLEMWQQQMDMSRAECKRQADMIYKQITSELRPNEEFQERFKRAFHKFTDTIYNKWTAKDLVDAWTQHYGPKFTEEELDRLIAFYTSDIGQKEVRVTKAVTVDFTRQIQKESQPLLQNAIKEYVRDLTTVAEDCNCKVEL